MNAPAAGLLPRLVIRGRPLLPIVQGGMGVGVSASRLAGSVARLGAVGTVASVDLRRMHPDLMQRTGRLRDSPCPIRIEIRDGEELYGRMRRRQSCPERSDPARPDDRDPELACFHARLSTVSIDLDAARLDHL